MSSTSEPDSSKVMDAGNVGTDAEIDPHKANAARVYDYLVGGDAWFEVDRAAAERAAAMYPGGLQAVKDGCRANRDFLARVVRWMVREHGIHQFLDLGTGVPSDDNVHAVAQAADPRARVVGVDYDPVVLAHAHTHLESTPEGKAAFISGDFKEPEKVLAEAGKTLDFSEPVGLLLIAILHLIPDEDRPDELITRLMDPLAPGSFLAITHVAADLMDLGGADEALTEDMAEPMVARTKDEIASRFVGGLELVPPGIVPVDKWHPDQQGADRPVLHWGLVARKPGEAPPA
jgi:S-adenosyl methyltransferase